MSALKAVLKSILPTYKDTVKALNQEHGEKVVSQVTVGAVYGGMRGVNGLICDTSTVDPYKGVVYRGRPIADLVDKLPEEVFYLLLTNELPDAASLESLRAEIASRSELPAWIEPLLRSLPADTHPMTMYNTAMVALQHGSVFAQRYDEGMTKGEFWESALEDSLSLLGLAPAVAAAVYRVRYGKGSLIASDKSLDLGANLAHMMGASTSEKDGFAKLIQVFLTTHADHESGNASAFTSHTVGSTLADPYYAYAAGMCALAGPLHGKANQDCLSFVLELFEEFGTVPNEEQVRAYAWELLNGGKVIPGYGHAVLRAEDPRFTALYHFGQKYCAEDPIFKTVSVMYQVIPSILKEHGKAANPYPNVDAASGALLYHFGVKDVQFYTVLFGVARAIGVLAQLILNRAIGAPIMRPKSVSTEWIKATVAK